MSADGAAGAADRGERSPAPAAEPRRDAAHEGARLHPWTVVTAAGTALKELAGTAALWLAVRSYRAERFDADFALVAGTVALVAGLAVGWLRWRATRWWLRDDGIEVRSGVVERQRRVVPYATLHAVELRQPLAYRLLGLAALHGDTAATSANGGGELSLDALARGDAERLRETLLARRAAAMAGATSAQGEERAAHAAEAASATTTTGGPPSVGAAAPHAREPVLRLGTARLALAGATASEAGAVIVGLFGLLQTLDGLDDLRRRVLGDAVDRAAAVLGSGSPDWLRVAFGAAAVLLVIALLGWGLSVARTLVRWHGYDLARVDRALHLSHGLTDRAARVVALDRVEAVRIVEGPLRRLVGLAELRVDVAGRGIGEALEERFEGIGGPLVPAATADEVRRLLALLLPGLTLDALPLQRSHPLAQLRLAALWAGPAVVAAAAGAVFLPATWRAAGVAAALAAAVVGAIAAHLAWRQRAWAVVGELLVTRRGVLGRATVIVPRARVRTAHVAASPLQRRLALVSVRASTAAYGARVLATDVTAAQAAVLTRASGLGDVADGLAGA